MKVLDPDEKTILHIPNVNSRESTEDKHQAGRAILEALGEWQGIDQRPASTRAPPDGKLLKDRRSGGR